MKSRKLVVKRKIKAIGTEIHKHYQDLEKYGDVNKQEHFDKYISILGKINAKESFLRGVLWAYRLMED